MASSPPSDFEFERACACLESSGITVLDRRWQPPGGQDQAPVIAAWRQTLIVCDVRIITAASRDSITQMSAARARRLRRLAVAWMDAHAVRYEQIRLDAIGIIREGPGGYTITHAMEVA